MINGKKPQPAITLANNKDKQDARDLEDNKALVLLLLSIDKDFTLSVTTCNTAAAAWKYLAGRFD